MTVESTSYRKLLKRVREISLLSSAREVLTWDQETYLPPKALSYRAEQLAYLGGEAHRQFTTKAIARLIADCEQVGYALDSDEAANVREWRRRYDRATKIPTRLVEKLARTSAHARA